jgi:MYXO-CTERM domain-containing protein
MHIRRAAAALPLLASLLFAFASAPTATAMYVECPDEEPDCQQGPPFGPVDVTFEVREDCDDGEDLCLVLVAGDFLNLTGDAPVNLTIVNEASAPASITFRTDGHLDDPVDDQGNYTSRRSELLLEFEVEANATVTENATVPTDADGVLLEADAAGAEASHREPVMQYFLAASGDPEPALGEDLEGDAEGDLDDGNSEADDADTPSPAAAIVGLVVLALVALRRRTT